MFTVLLPTVLGGGFRWKKIRDNAFKGFMYCKFSTILDWIRQKILNRLIKNDRETINSLRVNKRGACVSTRYTIIPKTVLVDSFKHTHPPYCFRHYTTGCWPAVRQKNLQRPVCFERRSQSYVITSCHSFILAQVISALIKWLSYNK